MPIPAVTPASSTKPSTPLSPAGIQDVSPLGAVAIQMSGATSSASVAPRPPINWAAIARSCRAILPARGVVAARQELLAYDCDGLTLHRWEPPLVVLPETTDQVAALLRLCHREGVPFVARGSGTGLSGGAVAETPALVIATTRMRQVLEIDLPNRRITVQPGVINSWVTRAAR